MKEKADSLTHINESAFQECFLSKIKLFFI